MKKPFAYISAAWSGQEFTDTDQAAVYCRKVYLAGFTPICPILYLPHFLNDTVHAEHKDGIDRRGNCCVAAMSSLSAARKWTKP